MSRALKMLPLLVLYLVLVVLLKPGEFISDEPDYIQYAVNITHGTYAPGDNPYIWFGPGYPLILAPFAALGGAWDAARLLNALLLFGAVVLLFEGLLSLIEERYALIAAYALGLQPAFFKELPHLMSETLAAFLAALVVFAFIRLVQAARSERGIRWFHVAGLGAAFAALALTKVFFGLVLITCLVLALIAFAALRTSAMGWTSAALAAGLALCTPWLAYTYARTGQPFYWSSSGGLSLYWMASPYDGDLGNWYAPDEVLTVPELYENHGAFFEELAALSWVDQDDLLMQVASENIRENPIAYAEHVAANIGRLLFDYPYTLKEQKLSTYYYIVPGVFIVALSVLAAALMLLRPHSIPVEAWGLLLLIAVSFGGTALLSAYNRMLIPILPMLVSWAAMVLPRTLELRLKPAQEIA